MRRIYVLTDEEASLFGATAHGLGCTLRELLDHLEWFRNYVNGPPHPPEEEKPNG